MITGAVLAALLLGQAEVVEQARKMPEERPAAVQAPKESEIPWWQKLKVTGFARLGVFYTLPVIDEALVGGNGGFRVADFRLNAEFRPIDKLTVYASVELAAPLVDPLDPTRGRRIVELRDAFVQYTVAPALEIKLGQYRPGYYAEMLLADGLVPFVQRSILASGLAPPEGYAPRQPLAPDRQIGLQLGSQRLGQGKLGFRYSVGLFNGAGQNQLYNDNNLPMPVGRVELDVVEQLHIGANAYYNVSSQGDRPNRLYTRGFGYGVDIEGSHRGFSGLLGFLGKSNSYSYAGLQSDTALGAIAQARYFHEASGLEVAARFAWYEPSNAQVDDQTVEVAGMVGWRPFKLPFRVLVQYTHRSEEPRVTFLNDSIDAMLHAVW